MRTVKYDGTRDYGTEAGRNRSTEGKAMAVKRHVNTHVNSFSSSYGLRREDEE